MPDFTKSSHQYLSTALLRKSLIFGGSLIDPVAGRIIKVTTFYRYLRRPSLLLAGVIIIIALLFPIPVVLAEPADDPCSSTLSGPVQAKDIIDALKQGDGIAIDCSNRIIEGDLNFHELKASFVPKQVSGEEEKVIHVNRPLKFRRAIFKGNISTRKTQSKDDPRVIFKHSVDFTGVDFEGYVNFDGVDFEKRVEFGGGHFFTMASYTDSVFSGFSNFGSTQFDERALFRNSVFHEDAIFTAAVFKWIAFFHHTIFDKKAHFLYTRFFGPTVFTQSHFNGTARFIGTAFYGPGYFSDCVFGEQVWFLSGVRFEQSVTFQGSDFRKKDVVGSSNSGQRPPVIFGGVEFHRDATFSDTSFNRVAFSEVGTAVDQGLGTVFRGRADFRGASFKKLALRGTIFLSDVDFSGADLGSTIDFTNVDFKRSNLQITWKQLLDEEKQNQKFIWSHAFDPGGNTEYRDKNRNDFFVFLSLLESKFRDRNQLEDAAEARYLVESLKGSEMGLMSRVWDTVFMKWLYGYGVKPWYQVWASLIIILFCTFIYMRSGALLNDQTNNKKLRLRIAEIPVDWSGRKAGADNVVGSSGTSVMQVFWRSLHFSTYVFTKIGYGGVQASRQYQFVVLLEWLFGLMLWVMFIINLSNRWPVLSRILSMT